MSEQLTQDERDRMEYLREFFKDPDAFRVGKQRYYQLQDELAELERKEGSVST